MRVWVCTDLIGLLLSPLSLLHAAFAIGFPSLAWVMAKAWAVSVRCPLPTSSVMCALAVFISFVPPLYFLDHYYCLIRARKNPAGKPVCVLTYKVEARFIPTLFAADRGRGAL